MPWTWLRSKPSQWSLLQGKGWPYSLILSLCTGNLIWCPGLLLIINHRWLSLDSQVECQKINVSMWERQISESWLLTYCSNFVLKDLNLKHFLSARFFLILYLFECMQIPQHPWRGVIGQSAVISPLLPPYGSQELNSGHQAWRQALWHTDPSSPAQSERP